MTRPTGPEKPDDDLLATAFGLGRRKQRRERIVQEILANRRGEYTVPTWVLALCLALMIAVIVAVLALY